MCCDCCLLRNCCCCLSLKCGTIFAGVWSLVFAALNAVQIFLSIFMDDDETLKDVTSKSPIISVENYETTLWVNLAIYTTYAVFAIILLVGVCKRTRGCLIPWLIISVILVIMVIVHLVIFIITIIQGHKMSGEDWSNLVIAIVGVLFNLHLAQVVYSYFRYRMGEPDDYVV